MKTIQLFAFQVLLFTYTKDGVIAGFAAVELVVGCVAVLLCSRDLLYLHHLNKQRRSATTSGDRQSLTNGIGTAGHNHRHSASSSGSTADAESTRLAEKLPAIAEECSGANSSAQPPTD